MPDAGPSVARSALHPCSWAAMGRARRRGRHATWETKKRAELDGACGYVANCVLWPPGCVAEFVGVRIYTDERCPIGRLSLLDAEGYRRWQTQ